MRFVILSDLHAHAWSAFAKGEGANNSRLLQSLRILDESLARARSEGCPWIFAGDIVHTAGYVLNPVMSGILSILMNYPDVPKLAVWGNHDVRGVGGKITLDETVWASILRTIPNLTVLDPSVVPITAVGGITIAGAGYQPKESLLEYGPVADIGIYHQTISGTITPSGHILDEGIHPSELRARHSMSIVGHVHHCQQFDNILIPGSPEHHNFGDKGEHGWWILDIQKGKKTSVEFVPGNSPQFLTVDGPSEIVEGDGNFYRIQNLSLTDVIPEGTIAIGAKPTTVEQRDLLHGISQVTEILQVWMREHPPEGEPSSYLAAGEDLLRAQDPIRLRPYQTTQLILHNFCSYADATFNLPQGIRLIVGEGRDYPSNGAGKTTLAGEALFWLIFGKNTKGLAADEVVRWGTSECFVEGSFTDLSTGGTLKVVRSRYGSSGSLDVIEDGIPWGAASSTDMTTKLLRHLGLTQEIYQNLGYFSQEKVLLFASATDGDRKNVLADLTGLSSYQEASSEAGTKASRSFDDLAKVKAIIDLRLQNIEEAEAELEEVKISQTLWIAAEKDRKEALQERLDQAKKAQRDLRMEERLQRLQASFRRAQKRKEALLDSSLEDQIEEIWKTLTAQSKQTLEDGKKLCAAALRDLGMEVGEARKEIEKLSGTKDAIELWRKEIITLDKEEKYLFQMITKEKSEKKQLETHLGNIQTSLREFDSGEARCPTCGQLLDKAQRLQYLKELVTEKDELTILDKKLFASLEERRKKQAWIEERQAFIDDIMKKLNEKTDELTTLSGRLDKYDRLLGYLEVVQKEQGTFRETAKEMALKEQEKERQVLRNKISSRRLKVDSFVARKVKEMEKEIRSLETAIATVQPNPHADAMKRALDRLKSSVSLASAAEKEMKDLQLKLDIFEYWKKGFSKQGIQSLLMEEIATLFNKNRGGVFPLLTQGVFDVQFSTLSRTRAGELREKTEFLVTKRGDPIPYGALSGGERRRVDLGIMITLAQSVSEWMQIPGILGCLTFDEVFGFLDSSGAEGLYEALSQVQKQIPSLFVITHDTHLQSLFPEAIRVKQDEDGISHLENHDG